MKKTIDTTEARDIVFEVIGKRVSNPTIITWCEQYGIGGKIGGRYRVNERRLRILLSGKQWKLLEKEKKEPT